MSAPDPDAAHTSHSSSSNNDSAPSTAAAAPPASSGNNLMPPIDLKICRDALASWRHPVQNAKNYIFLDPVDPAFFPTYHQVVTRPMDLGTLGRNLEAGNVYRSRHEFFADAVLIFDNALLFHGGKKDTAWVIKLAKEMKKLVVRERKAAEKRYREMTGDGGGGGGDASGSGAERKERKEKPPRDGGGGNGNGGGGGKKQKAPRKLSLKIKPPSQPQQHQSSSSAHPSSSQAESSSVSSSSAAQHRRASSQSLDLGTDSVEEGEVEDSGPVAVAAPAPPPAAKVKKSGEKKSKKDKPAKLKLSLAAAAAVASKTAPSGAVAVAEGGAGGDATSATKKVKKSKKSKKDKGGKDKGGGKKEKDKSVSAKGKPSKPKPKLKLTLSLKMPPKDRDGKADGKEKGGGKKEKEKDRDREGKVRKDGKGGKEKSSKPSSSKKEKKEKKERKESPKTVMANKEKKSPSPAGADAPDGSSGKAGKRDEKRAKTPPTTTSVPSKSAPSRGKELPKGVSGPASSSSKPAKEKKEKKEKQQQSSATKKEATTQVAKSPNTKEPPAPAPAPATKIKVRLNPPSRGKELPKGVVAPGGGGGGGGPAPKKSEEAATASASSSSSAPATKPPTAAAAAAKGKAKPRLSLTLGTKKVAKKERATPPPPPAPAPAHAHAHAHATPPPPPSSTSSGTAAAAAAPPPPPPGGAMTLHPHRAAAPVVGPPPGVVPPAPVAQGPPIAARMDPRRRGQCAKVLSALKRRQGKNTVWFLKPVSDARLVEDYRAKIRDPMDFGTIATKLEQNSYSYVSDFVRDVRRVFGNCLRYNTGAGDTFRPVALEVLREAEGLFLLFLQKPEGTNLVYPKLLYCWEVCISALDVLLGQKNPDDGLPTAHFFLHPASFFFGGELPQDYLQKVQTPMDLGTVTSNLIEGSYQSVGAVCADCRIICENCYSYYKGRDDGVAIVEQAERLQGVMAQQLGALVRYDQSPAGKQAQAAAFFAPPTLMKRPSKELLHGILRELRSTIYTDRFTKLSESAAVPFEKPVDVSIFPDYPQYVDTFMDLETVEKNISHDAYETPEDFEYDVQLIFKNCERYNVPKKNDHILALSRHCAKVFRKLYHNRMKTYEEPAVAQGKDGTLKRAEEERDKKRSLSSSPKPELAPSKRMKTEAGPGSTQSSKRLSISRLNQESPVPLGRVSPKPKSGSPKLSISVGASKSLGGKKKKTMPSTDSSTDTTIPLSVAISRVQESFTIRRSTKVLESWEAACHRFYRELTRHPWLSAARPKYIFHVPVPTLFPELTDAYARKIEKPMDLTTAEGKLLQGGLYNGPQEFINDIALVFDNAISFNQAGKDDGDPTSCAYYDAAKHLLRYSRWLSLDHLSAFLTDAVTDDEHQSEGADFGWELTTSYRQAAKEEMEDLVLNQPMEQSEEGDRYTWMEAECEKLLKSMRHQSDLRYMTYFIQPVYPGDYTAFVSKPMDWEQCQRNLQQRVYDTIGEAVEDLRLIFSNALKYNARAKGTDTVSGRAYDAAVYMSTKLEAAIQKMLLSVSDRLEREKLDQIASERQFEAAEREEEERYRAEQVRLRAVWQKERDKSKKNNVEVETRVELVETVKVIKPKLHQRKHMVDFDFPFYDDDDDPEETHMEAMHQQRLLFEKQKRERSKVLKIARSVGNSMFGRMAEREILRVKVAEKQNQKQQSEPGLETTQVVIDSDLRQAQDTLQNASHTTPVDSSRSSGGALNGGKKIKMTLRCPKRNKKKRARPPLTSF